MRYWRSNYNRNSRLQVTWWGKWEEAGSFEKRGEGDKYRKKDRRVK